VRLIAVAIVFAGGTIVSRLLLASAPARLSIDLAQPIPVVTWWASAAVPFVITAFATVAVALVPYLLSLRRATPSIREIAIGAALALFALLFWLPLFSSDVYAYAAYGEMLRSGINPYVHQHLPQSNALFRDAMWQWSGSLPVCVYGGAFVAIAAAIVTIAQPLGIVLQLHAFRFVSCVAFLVATYALSRCGSRDDAERGRFAALFLALNPVALWAAAEGHNDTLMLALALCGVALFRRKPAAGAFVATLAGAIKSPGILAGGVLAIQSIVTRRDWSTATSAVAALALVTVLSLPLVYGATHDLAPHGHYAPFASVQSLHPAVAVLLAIAIVLRARRATTHIDRLTTLALAAWLLIPNPYPWYALWLLPLGAWTTDRRIAATILAVTAAAMLRYIPDAVGIPDEPATLVLGLAALLAYTPLAGRAIIVRS
jgi:hypothetical protein